MQSPSTLECEAPLSPRSKSPKRHRAPARSLNKAQLRRSWLTVHRWLGLTVGLLFVFLGLTGSLLVFDHAIDEWLNPQLLLTEGDGNQHALRQVIHAAETAYSGAPSPAVAISSPRVERGVWTVWFQNGSEEAPTFTGVYVDPYTGRVTGQRVWGEDLMSLIYKLHYTLLAGKTGETIVGLTGLVLLTSVCSGVYPVVAALEERLGGGFCCPPRTSLQLRSSQNGRDRMRAGIGGNRLHRRVPGFS